MGVKAVALLSGGLDSSLAIRLVQEQGVEVRGLHFVSVFNGTAPETSRLLTALRVARELGIEAKTINFTREQLRLVRAPAHGYGANMNPCIDCHMAMLRLAAEHLGEVGAGFLVSGEVVGQRPMSQRRHVLDQIDRETGLGGLVLRPLSARLLPPTIPEQRGWVDREKLLGIHGRGRKEQLALAARFGIVEHASPAGGCLLTEPAFGRRLRDLVDALEEGEELDLSDVHLLKVGRHFRLAPRVKAVIGRRERENGVILTFSCPDDLLLTTHRVPGPTTLLRGPQARQHVHRAAALTARYSKLREEPEAAVSVRRGRRGAEEVLDVVDVAPIDDARAAELRVG